MAQPPKQRGLTVPVPKPTAVPREELMVVVAARLAILCVVALAVTDTRRCGS
jgi:hypothetical protein